MSLEDEGGNIVLKANSRTVLVGAATKPFSLSEIPTGIVVGVVGRQNEEGEFEVDAVCLSGLPPQQSPRSASPLLHSSSSSGNYPSFPLYSQGERRRNMICIVSGLANSSPLAWELVQQYLMGFIGGPSVWLLF